MYFTHSKLLGTVIVILRGTITRKVCDYIIKTYITGFDYEGSSNSVELNAILTQHIMIRRLKRDVLGELPDKVQ